MIPWSLAALTFDNAVPVAMIITAMVLVMMIIMVTPKMMMILIISYLTQPPKL